MSAITPEIEFEAAMLRAQGVTIDDLLTDLAGQREMLIKSAARLRSCDPHHPLLAQIERGVELIDRALEEPAP